VLKAVDTALLLQASGEAGKSAVDERIHLLGLLLLAAGGLIVAVMALSWYRKRRSGGSD